MNVHLTHCANKVGVAGAIFGSFGCAACFPALASIGTAVGLGFLGQWEGVLVRVLIPAFLLLALAANWLGWFSHHRWQRSAAASIGPILALIGAFGLMGIFGLVRGFLPAEVARSVFYIGLAVMLGTATWDFVRPSRRCPAQIKRGQA